MTTDPVDEDSQTDAEVRTLREELLHQAQRHPGFMERLAKRTQEDKPILDRLTACPSINRAYLAAVDQENGALIRCCGVKGHDGPHWFRMEWSGRPSLTEEPQ